MTMTSKVVRESGTGDYWGEGEAGRGVRRGRRGAQRRKKRSKGRRTSRVLRCVHLPLLLSFPSPPLFLSSLCVSLRPSATSAYSPLFSPVFRLNSPVPIPRIAIVGRPNVGKSSLLNMLASRRVSIV